MVQTVLATLAYQENQKVVGAKSRRKKQEDIRYIAHLCRLCPCAPVSVEVSKPSAKRPKCDASEWHYISSVVTFADNCYHVSLDSIICRYSIIFLLLCTLTFLKIYDKLSMFLQDCCISSPDHSQIFNVACWKTGSGLGTRLWHSTLHCSYAVCLRTWNRVNA